MKKYERVEIMPSILAKELKVKKATWSSPEITRRAEIEELLVFPSRFGTDAYIRYEGELYFIEGYQHYLQASVTGRRIFKVTQKELDDKRAEVEEESKKSSLRCRVQSINIQDYTELVSIKTFYKCKIILDKDKNFVLFGNGRTKYHILDFVKGVKISKETMDAYRNHGLFLPKSIDRLEIIEYGKPLEDVLDWIEKGIKEMREEKDKKKAQAFEDYGKCSSNE